MFSEIYCAMNIYLIYVIIYIYILMKLMELIFWKKKKILFTYFKN